MIVFDRAYNYYQQFALWAQREVYFITLMKRDASFTVIEVLRTHYRKKGQAKVLSGEVIELEYNPEDETGKKNMRKIQKLRLRRVRYQDGQNRYYEFLCNNFEITAEEIAFLYKKRCGIELLFRKMKQNFQLHYFYRENVNAIYTQVWCTLIAQLLLTVTQKIAQAKKAFSVVASLVWIHLISMLDVNELLRIKQRAIRSRLIPPGLQLSFNMQGVNL